MTAHAYIFMKDVPSVISVRSVRRFDDGAAVELVAFPECPMIGQITKVEAGEQVEFPFPRDIGLRNSLMDWLAYWGINFTVVM